MKVAQITGDICVSDTKALLNTYDQIDKMEKQKRSSR